MAIHVEKFAPRTPVRQSGPPRGSALRSILAGHARRDGSDGLPLAVTPQSRTFVPRPEPETWWVRHVAWFDLGTAAAIITLATVVALHFRAFG